jgi:hypothetical protein
MGLFEYLGADGTKLEAEPRMEQWHLASLFAAANKGGCGASSAQS